MAEILNFNLIFVFSFHFLFYFQSVLYTKKPALLRKYSDLIHQCQEDVFITFWEELLLGYASLAVHF